MNFFGFVLLIAAFFSHLALAENVDLSIHENYISTRAKGMGGAFTAVADDHSAMFYNPAALARRKDGNVHLFLRAAISDDYLDLFEDIENAEKEADEETAISNVLQNNYGNNFYSRVPTIGGVWVRPNWGIALIPADLTIDLGIHQQIGPALAVNAYLDTTLAYSYARNVKWGQKGLLSVGGTVRAIHRAQVSESVSFGQLADDSEVFDVSDANEGLFLDLDLGFLYTPKIPKRGFFSLFRFARPTFAFVGRNLVDSGPMTNLHLLDEKSGDPPNLYRRFDLGSKWQLPKFWVFDPKFAFDIRNMAHPNWTLEKGSHLGFEMFWTVFSWWKGYWSVGMNQWFFDFSKTENWTLGFGARFAWFQIDVSTWQEDMGTKDIDIKNRRYMVELSLDF